MECGVFGQAVGEKAVASFGVGAVQADFFLSQRELRSFVEVYPLDKFVVVPAGRSRKNGALGICLERHLIQDTESGEWVFSAQVGQLVPTRRICAYNDGKEERPKIAAREVDAEFSRLYSQTFGKKVALFLQFLQAVFRRLQYFFWIIDHKTVTFQNGVFPRMEDSVGKGASGGQARKAGITTINL